MKDYSNLNTLHSSLTLSDFGSGDTHVISLHGQSFPAKEGKKKAIENWWEIDFSSSQALKSYTLFIISLFALANLLSK